MGHIPRAALLLLLIAVGLVSAPAAGAYVFGDTVRQLAPEETVFDWTTDRCEDAHIPDLPARAFRDASNQIQLTTSHSPNNRRMIGPTLGSVEVDCGVTMSSHLDADPARYDDSEWIDSPYTLDGTNVVALVHEEYHGWDHPGMCSETPNPPRRSSSPAPIAGFDPACWYNAITLATSSDGGATYTHATPPRQLLASVPYPYIQDTGPYGYFEPSNIIRRSDGYFYAMIHAEAYNAQQLGTCVMRTRNPTDPKSWRAWDGAGYNVTFINPYTDPDPPEQHVCTPVAFTQIEKMVSSLTYNTYFGKYLLVGHTGAWDPEQGRIVYGFYYSTSSDLINWSQRELLMEAELPWSYLCGDDNPVLYPAVLQPTNATPTDPPATTTASRNFETTGKKGYLYFTRFNYDACVQTLDRDLIRIPFEFL
jgi:hypothetical protein